MCRVTSGFVLQHISNHTRQKEDGSAEKPLLQLLETEPYCNELPEPKVVFAVQRPPSHQFMQRRYPSVQGFDFFAAGGMRPVI
ncbi:MAG: hypothetical protein GY820_06760 [Gammaproteobacteria bacterium]|nr:hypothetical protein [Gammaproteobacteria bacterium]